MGWNDVGNTTWLWGATAFYGLFNAAKTTYSYAFSGGASASPGEAAENMASSASKTASFMGTAASYLLPSWSSAAAYGTAAAIGGLFVYGGRKAYDRYWQPNPAQPQMTTNVYNIFSPDRRGTGFFHNQAPSQSNVHQFYPSEQQCPLPPPYSAQPGVVPPHYPQPPNSQQWQQYPQQQQEYFPPTGHLPHLSSDHLWGKHYDSLRERLNSPYLHGQEFYDRRY